MDQEAAHSQDTVVEEDLEAIIINKRFECVSIKRYTTFVYISKRHLQAQIHFEHRIRDRRCVLVGDIVFRRCSSLVGKILL